MADFKSAAMFDLISEAFKEEGKTLVPKIKGIYCFQVTGGPSGKTENWILDAKNGNGSVERGGKGKADVTITISDSDLVELMSGKLNPQKAFFQGKLKIKGNMGLAMKMQDLQKEAEKRRSKL